MTVEVTAAVRIVMDLPAGTTAEEAYRLARELIEDHATPVMTEAAPDTVTAIKFHNVTGFRIQKES